MISYRNRVKISAAKNKDQYQAGNHIVRHNTIVSDKISQEMYEEMLAVEYGGYDPSYNDLSTKWRMSEIVNRIKSTQKLVEIFRDNHEFTKGGRKAPGFIHGEYVNQENALTQSILCFKPHRFL